MWRRPEEWGKLIYQWVRLFWRSDPWQRRMNLCSADAWCFQIQTEQSGRGQKEEGLPGKPLSMTQFPWLERTFLFLPVGGQRLCEAMFGECSTGNHEYYCWLEPLATGDKWGKEGKKNTKTWSPSPTTSLWGCPQYKWDFLNSVGVGTDSLPCHH